MSAACAELAEERRASQAREKERLVQEVEKKERGKVKKLKAERRTQELEQKIIANEVLMKEINAKLALLSRSLPPSSCLLTSLEVSNPPCELQNVSRVSTSAAPSNPSVSVFHDPESNDLAHSQCLVHIVELVNCPNIDSDDPYNIEFGLGPYTNFH